MFIPAFDRSSHPERIAPTTCFASDSTITQVMQNLTRFLRPSPMARAFSIASIRMTLPRKLHGCSNFPGCISHHNAQPHPTYPKPLTAASQFIFASSLDPHSQLFPPARSLRCVPYCPGDNGDMLLASWWLDRINELEPWLQLWRRALRDTSQPTSFPNLNHSSTIK